MKDYNNRGYNIRISENALIQMVLKKKSSRKNRTTGFGSKRFDYQRWSRTGAKEVSVGRPILQKQFRTELSEIIKASPEFDERCSCAYTINFYEDDVEDEKVSFRVGWWDDGKRFRMIPRESTEGTKKRRLNGQRFI